MKRKDKERVEGMLKGYRKGKKAGATHTHTYNGGEDLKFRNLIKK